jgi:hypothetical protein
MKCHLFLYIYMCVYLIILLLLLLFIIIIIIIIIAQTSGAMEERSTFILKEGYLPVL